MKNLFYVILMSAFITGCFASAPKKVDPVYLNEKSEAEEAKLESIEKEIINITDSKAKIEKNVKIAELEIKISKKEKNSFEADEELLNEKQKLNILKKDTAAIEEMKQKIAASNKSIAASKKQITYLEAKEDNLEKQVAVKEAELAVKVSEKSLLEAKIARANQDKMMKGADEKQKKNLIDVTKYQKYHDSQKSSLERAQKSLASSDKELKEAEKKK